ncbi:MAG: hypothetical protein AB1487_10235 [Thermodesulfobacteriota bacterium]
MKPWWQVAEPHKDILKGKLSEAVFAADLGDVAVGRGPDEYRDARLFFQKTYITKGIETLLSGVLSRIAGKGDGDPVIQIQTPFGGGKTHSLLSLYHVVKHFNEDMPHTIVGDAIKKLEEELWYFHSAGNLYSFKNQPNLNRVIVDREVSVSDSQMESCLRDFIQKKMAGKEFEPYLWPNNSADVPDNKNIKLAILSPDFVYPSGDTTGFINELFARAGIGFRVYKNAFFVSI